MAREISTESVSGQGNETILLVEDEQMILDLATLLLQSHGYTVLATSTPSEALDVADQHAGETLFLHSQSSHVNPVPPAAASVGSNSTNEPPDLGPTDYLGTTLGACASMFNYGLIIPTMIAAASSFGRFH